ncbi:MAG: tautomerase family protein [Mycobacterium sp.]|nr:tautomerase family protein [Mycobacterium sp.]
MPIYQVITGGVELNGGQRDVLAKRFTEVHHAVTNAPEPFIRVIFQALQPGLIYTAGEVTPSFILIAGCRGGRTDDTRLKLMKELHAVIRMVTNMPEDQIVIVVSDTPASWVMEAGMVLPETHHETEAAWMQELQAKFPGKYENYS